MLVPKQSQMIKSADKLLADPAIAASFKTSRLLIGIDRDGTLVDIAPRPELAPVTESALETVTSLTSLPDVTCSIVSARSLPHLRRDFGNTGALLAGNYGLEIALSGDKLLVNSDAVNSRARLAAVLTRLKHELGYVQGFIIEDHGLSICGHWHLVAKEQRAYVHNVFAILKSDFADLRFVDQMTSYEVFPALEWDKGRALDEIARHVWGNKYLSDDEMHKSKLVFIGDSIGDEPAFDFVNRHHGYSIRVGQFEATCAQFALPGPHSVLAFLNNLVKLRTTGS